MPKFTEDLLDSLTVEPGKRDRLVFDTDVRGLGVRVTAKSKTFLVQWTDPATKRKQREPLGLWGSITIKAARDAAKIRLGKVAGGINPRAERIKAIEHAKMERAEKSLTFDKLLSSWADLHLSKKRPGYAAEAERAVRRVFADLMAKPASRIKKSDVKDRLDILIRAGKVTTASRTLAYGRACFAWAIKRGDVIFSPFSGLPITSAANQRERFLTDREVREVWQAAGTLAQPISAFIRFALLTLARRDEVAGLRWSEIDEQAALWTIPGSRTKNGKPHFVHLSGPALEVLKTVPRLAKQDLVFSTTGKTPISGFSRFKVALDKGILAARAEVAQKAGVAPEPLVPFVLHDFRRSGVTALAALGFDSIVADKLLNHQPAKLRGVAAVYQRHDFARERARALDVWAGLCTQTISENGANDSRRAA